MGRHPTSEAGAAKSLELFALLHAGIVVIATTWAFGGNAKWVQVPLAILGSFALPITLVGLLGAESRERNLLSGLRLLWPFAAFNLLVLISCLSPNFRLGHIEGAGVLLPLTYPAWRPSTAVPATALKGLWIFDGVFLTAFNVYLAVRRRSALRGFLLVLGINALILSIFGTIQKLAHATGLYFGHYPTPQAYFFATFVYDNHWSSFIILMTASCMGLGGYYCRRAGAETLRHNPILAAVFACLLLAVTVPLSGSRFCSLLLGLLLGAVVLRWAGAVLIRRHQNQEPIGPVVAGLVATALIGLGVLWFVAGDVISARLELTRSQISTMQHTGSIGSRAALYRDTWRMARARLVFGWGMDSYPVAFPIFNLQEPNPLDHLAVVYHDAHSDWLQSLAEHGLVGSVFVPLCAWLPLAGLRRYKWREAIPVGLFAGCALVLLYAVIEFPFGNTAVVLVWWICFFTAVRYVRLGGRTEREAPAV